MTKICELGLESAEWTRCVGCKVDTWQCPWGELISFCPVGNEKCPDEYRITIFDETFESRAEFRMPAVNIELCCRECAVFGTHKRKCPIITMYDRC